jgi:halocyanin-like protein
VTAIDNRDGPIPRRTVLRTAAGVATAGLAAAGASTAAAQSDEFGGWFDDVSNYDGVVDRTGESEVTVAVGAEGNGGNLAFDPAAVRVDPGTTVVWEWTGEGGAHNVVDRDGAFDSGDAVTDAGTVFEHTFGSEGTFLYLCEPHEALGMKGAVVVEGGDGGGGGDAGGTGQLGDPEYDGWFDDVSNYDGTTVDARGQTDVTVGVGTEGNGGNLAFDPPAVHVDPGTTVVWEWTGEGGAHNVVAEDSTFDSGDAVTDAGTVFEYTFEDDGRYRYICEPHEALGMKGAVVVGTDYPGAGAGGDGGGVPAGPTGPTPLMWGFASLLFAMLSAPVAHSVYRESRSTPPGRTGPVEVTEAEEPEVAEQIAHDEYDPLGTLALVLVYFAIVVLMWAFMYFVEFLGGPTVIG